MPDPNEDDEDLEEFDDEDEDLEDDEEDDLDDDEDFLDEDEDEDDDLDDDDDLDLDDLDEDEEEDEMQSRNNAAHPDREPVRVKGGVRADDDLAAERLNASAAGEKTHEHQDDLLDEGVEETFPASDPVSVKRIT